MESFSQPGRSPETKLLLQIFSLSLSPYNKVSISLFFSPGAVSVQVFHFPGRSIIWWMSHLPSEMVPFRGDASPWGGQGCGEGIVLPLWSDFNKTAQKCLCGVLSNVHRLERDEELSFLVSSSDEKQKGKMGRGRLTNPAGKAQHLSLLLSRSKIHPAGQKSRWIFIFFFNNLLHLNLIHCFSPVDFSWVQFRPDQLCLCFKSTAELKAFLSEWRKRAKFVHWSCKNFHGSFLRINNRSPGGGRGGNFDIFVRIKLHSACPGPPGCDSATLPWLKCAQRLHPKSDFIPEKGKVIPLYFLNTEMSSGYKYFKSTGDCAEAENSPWCSEYHGKPVCKMLRYSWQTGGIF